ncbi:FAD-binding domain-containing protein [Lepidopterella palustris CBS 459.81]|uniref:Delta(24)-sterol reductase n=1 Tax=Lepidopterella palustris CBS 459.81 TaxID=1314670 RepID=A0A8E2JH91_9PEZI|nr:FAD-binding domain-containing protein [Lepidopterella palustris CBS 459.81]
MGAHEDSVASISASVRQFHEKKIPFRIYHGSTNSTRPAAFQRDKMVDTSNLTRVLKVDTVSKIALVEPNVPMDRFVEATLQHGLLPPVVMEFPGITTGGGFAGTSGESSSFKHGFFDRTTNSIEMVLANGEVVTASEKENTDLFHGAAGSFGTLGVLTLLEIRLIEAKKYVELTYHPVKSFAESVKKTHEATEDASNDYVDGILFGPRSGTVITGRLANALPPKPNLQRFTQSTDPWFYLHAKTILAKSPSTPFIEHVPLTDYLFRYDRGAFWTGTYAFKYFKVPFNRITRWALDHFMHTRIMYHALHASGMSKQYIIQDLAIPASHAQEFIEYVDETFGFYPLWLCPLRHDGKVSMAHPVSAGKEGSTTEGEEDLLNVGVWGPGSTSRSAFIAANRQLEAKVHQLGGVKWLYAQAFYSEDEFWDIYDRKGYEALREKYHATALPSIFDKVCVDLSKEGNGKGEKRSIRARLRSFALTTWPLSGVYGVYKAVAGDDYLLAK